MKYNRSREKVLATIAGICGAGAITFATIGGFQIDKTNKLDAKMKEILADTKLTSTYGEYIDSKRQAIESAYAGGVITLEEHDRKIENLISDEHLIEQKDQFMKEETAKIYDEAYVEYVKRGVTMAGCIIGGVTTGTLTMATLCSYIDEKNKNRNSDKNISDSISELSR